MDIILKKQFTCYTKVIRFKCSIGKTGYNPNFKKEGDLATPKGIFKLGLCLLIGKIEYKTIKDQN